MAVEKKKSFDQLKAEAIANGMESADFEQRVHELTKADEHLARVAAAAIVVRESMTAHKDHVTLVKLILRHNLTVADLKKFLRRADEEGWFEAEPKLQAALKEGDFLDAFGKGSVVRRRENLYFDTLTNPTKAFFRQGQARWPSWLQKLFLKKLVKLTKPGHTSEQWAVFLKMSPKQLAMTNEDAKAAIDAVAEDFCGSTAQFTPTEVELLLSAGRE